VLAFLIGWLLLLGLNLPYRPRPVRPPAAGAATTTEEEAEEEAPGDRSSRGLSRWTGLLRRQRTTAPGEAEADLSVETSDAPGTVPESET
jgi:hypothetical protein